MKQTLSTSQLRLPESVEKILRDGFGYYIANRKNTSLDVEPLIEYCLPRLASQRRGEAKRLVEELEALPTLDSPPGWSLSQHELAIFKRGLEKIKKRLSLLNPERQD